jgi:hypothetical protein
MSLLRKATFGRPTLLKPAVSHLSPGKSLLAPGQAKKASRNPKKPATTPPGTPLHWFDSGDTSTMWRDDEGTLPITGDGQAVLKWDNKGSAGTAVELIQSSAPSGPSVEFANDLLTFDGNDALQATVESPVQTPFTLAVAFRTTSALTNSVMGWPENSVEGMRVQVSGADGDFTVSHADVNTTVSHEVESTTVHGFIFTHDAADRWIYASFDPSDTTAEVSSIEEPVVDDILTVGAAAADGTDGLIGAIYHFVIWDRVIDAQEIADTKTFFTNENGVSWL